MDLNFLPDMGRITLRLLYREKTACLLAVTKVALIGQG
jgi:hypothetical protein